MGAPSDIVDRVGELWEWREKELGDLYHFPLGEIVSVDDPPTRLFYLFASLLLDRERIVSVLSSGERTVEAVSLRYMAGLPNKEKKPVFFVHNHPSSAPPFPSEEDLKNEGCVSVFVGTKIFTSCWVGEENIRVLLKNHRVIKDAIARVFEERTALSYIYYDDLRSLSSVDLDSANKILSIVRRNPDLSFFWGDTLFPSAEEALRAYWEVCRIVREELGDVLLCFEGLRGREWVVERSLERGKKILGVVGELTELGSPFKGLLLLAERTKDLGATDIVRNIRNIVDGVLRELQ